MKIDDMKAGREMDALVADKVTDWFCEIQTEITGYYHFESRQAETAPLAICRAALKSVGVE